MIRTQQLSNGEFTMWNDESGEMVVTRKQVRLSNSEKLKLQEREERIRIVDEHLRRVSNEAKVGRN